MQPDLNPNRHLHKATSRMPRRNTPLARRRRLNQLVKELAADLGFNYAAVTWAERGTLHQAATLLLQIERAQDQLVGGALIDSDTVIRLSSEARRLLGTLRSRYEVAGSPPWSPLRAALARSQQRADVEIAGTDEETAA
jgi:hypothetical protein